MEDKLQIEPNQIFDKRLIIWNYSYITKVSTVDKHNVRINVRI